MQIWPGFRRKSPRANTTLGLLTNFALQALDSGSTQNSPLHEQRAYQSTALPWSRGETGAPIQGSSEQHTNSSCIQDCSCTSVDKALCCRGTLLLWVLQRHRDLSAWLRPVIPNKYHKNCFKIRNVKENLFLKAFSFIPCHLQTASQPTS